MNKLSIRGRILYLLLLLPLVSCNLEESSIKKLTRGLDPINEKIVEQELHTVNHITIVEQLRLVKDVNLKKKMEELIDKHELCEINYYSKSGISYLFKCKNDSWDNFIDADEQYYLIRILNKESESEFVNLEQFADYRTELTKLNENWYFVRNDITYD